MFDKYLDRTNMTHHQYQKDGLRWILSNELNQNPICGVRGGFIADEMGLGKTIMMIGTMLCNFVNKTLIIVPPALIDQWYNQIARTTGHKSIIYHGENKKKISQSDLQAAKIVITTYGAITLPQNKKKLTLLHTIVWDRLIFDEAHHLRNANTQLYFSTRLLRSSIRWLVSGTPIQNRIKDFYNLCKMIRLPLSYYTNVDNLKQLGRSFILKRTKKQVGIILPDLIQSKIVVDWSNTREMELSQEIHSALAFSNVSAYKNNGALNNLNGTLPVLLRARQTCILPRLLSKIVPNSMHYSEAFNSTSKLDTAVKKILERKDNGSGKIIFCHFREEIDEIATRLTNAGITSIATFDGRTTDAKRSEILSHQHQILILQIQTGCEGLNLQEHYSEIYFISPHWNPSVEDQAIARCHRIGQTKVVYVDRFEMCDFNDDKKNINIERYVNSVQDFKRETIKDIIE
jgi:SNF2 family DNA or RNA helicase